MSTPNEQLNNLKALLMGGEGALPDAPEGLLAKKGLSVERLARASKLTRTAVYQYLAKKHRPTAPVLRRICEVLEIPFEVGLMYCTPAVNTGRPPMKSPSHNPA